MVTLHLESFDLEMIATNVSYLVGFLLHKFR